jgi:ATP sulfurylase
VREAIPGGRFNAFFPPSEEAYEVVYVQEKAGFAEAKLKHNGEDLAMLSIADLVNNPTAAAKYDESTASIGGYPAVEQGSTMTGVLVAGHFQVKAQSRQPDFTASDRAAWRSRDCIEAFEGGGVSGQRRRSCLRCSARRLSAPARARYWPC